MENLREQVLSAQHAITLLAQQLATSEGAVQLLTERYSHERIARSKAQMVLSQKTTNLSMCVEERSVLLHSYDQCTHNLMSLARGHA